MGYIYNSTYNHSVDHFIQCCRQKPPNGHPSFQKHPARGSLQLISSRGTLYLTPGCNSVHFCLITSCVVRPTSATTDTPWQPACTTNPSTEHLATSKFLHLVSESECYATFIQLHRATAVSGGPFEAGHEYELTEFRFHWGKGNDRGSEHTVNSKAFPMEVKDSYQTHACE